MIQLSQGRKPARPESRPIQDAHWALIQQCWSSIDQRPLAKDVLSSLQYSLRFFRMPEPLFDFLNLPHPSYAASPAFDIAPSLRAIHQQDIQNRKEKPIQDSSSAWSKAFMSRNTTSKTLWGDTVSPSGGVDHVRLV